MELYELKFDLERYLSMRLEVYKESYIFLCIFQRKGCEGTHVLGLNSSLFVYLELTIFK